MSAERSTSRYLITRVWKLRPWHLTAIAALTWAIALVPGLQVALTAQLVDKTVAAASGEGEVAAALTVLVQLAAMTVIARSAAAGARYLTIIAGLRVATDLATQIMRHGLSLDMETYESPEHYNKLQRASAEAQSGRAMALATGFIQTVGSFVTVLSVGAILLPWSPLAAFIAVVSPIPSAIISGFYGKERWKIDFRRSEERRKASYLQWLATNDQAYKEVAHYRIGATLLARYIDTVERFFVVDKSFSRRSEIWVALVDMLGLLGSLLALGIALMASIEAGEVGQVAGFIQGVSTLQGTTSALLLGIAAMFQNALFSQNLFGFLDLPKGRTSVGRERIDGMLTGGIEFRNVTFRYPGTTKKALDDVSFIIKAGERVALVGPNGGGKSTVVKLLCRLYEYDSGEILIDSIPLREYDIDSLRNAIGVVFQDFVRYELSAADNIGFGNIDHLSDRSGIADAAERSGAATLIGNLGHGFDTLLGRRFEGAEQLSVGQWQRVALARGFNSRGAVMILDEPSSALDPLAEERLVQAMNNVPAGTTSITVAHRFATIRGADRIIVVGDGHVLENGTHDDLVAEHGAYEQMYLSQAAHFRDSVTELNEQA
jgi:ATP-binding cassette subfamily B protein